MLRMIYMEIISITMCAMNRITGNRHQCAIPEKTFRMEYFCL